MSIGVLILNESLRYLFPLIIFIKGLLMTYGIKFYNLRSEDGEFWMYFSFFLLMLVLVFTYIEKKDKDNKVSKK